MKIVVSIDNYLYKKDGQYYVDNVANSIVNRYLAVYDSILLYARVTEVDELPKNINYLLDIEKIDVCELPFVRGGGQVIKAYPKIRKIAKNIVKNNDAFIIRIPSMVGFILAQEVICQNKIYGVEVVASPNELSKGESFFKGLMWRCLHSFMRKICANADCASYVTKETLQKTYPTRKPTAYVTNYSSVDLRKEFMSIERSALWDEGKSFEICHVANHVSGIAKGHYEVINVLCQLINKRYNVRVKFAGKDENSDSLKEYARKLGVEKYIEFIGFLDKNQLRDLLIKSDLLLFPSHSEGLPRVVIEAMAVSLPCVSSNVGGSAELLPLECVFDYKDVEGMTRQVERFITDKEYYLKMSKRNYEEAQQYESSYLQDKRIAFYNELLRLAKGK